MTTKQQRVYIALGANLGEPLKQLDNAVSVLNAHAKIDCIAMSPVYKSIPHGDIEQPDYHNAALEVKTILSPDVLLAFMHTIEQQNGRERTIRWGARTLDLDLILYGERVIDSEHLTVPHPRAHEREFVIKPLFDLNNALILATYGSVSDLLATLPLKNLTEVRHGITYHH